MTLTAGVETDFECQLAVVTATAEFSGLKRGHPDVVRPGLHREGLWMTCVAAEPAAVLPMRKDDRGDPVQGRFLVEHDITEDIGSTNARETKQCDHEQAEAASRSRKLARSPRPVSQRPLGASYGSGGIPSRVGMRPFHDSVHSIHPRISWPS